MIANDQPRIFGDQLIAAVSSADDGSMTFNGGIEEEIRTHRLAFLQGVGLKPENTTLVRVSYDDTRFDRYSIVTDDHKGEGMLRPKSGLVADALVTTQPGHGLFLPVADCVGVIIYDAKQRILMVSHVGRHSAEIDGARKSVAYLVDNFSTNSKDVLVWLSPAVGRVTYPLRAMDDRGLHEVIYEQLINAGVTANHIELSGIKTDEHDGYFSHSQFLAGNRASDGRFAIVAAMREQGEPAA